MNFFGVEKLFISIWKNNGNAKIPLVFLKIAFDNCPVLNGQKLQDFFLMLAEENRFKSLTAFTRIKWNN